MKVTGLWLLVLIGVATAADLNNQLLTTLHCDTSLLLDQQTLADEAPFAAITADTARVIYQLQNATLRDQVYINILASETFNVTVLNKNGSAEVTDCRTLGWSDFTKLSAIDIFPGNHLSCVGIKGCDGMGLNSIRFLVAVHTACPRANIRQTAGNFTLSMRIRFSSVGDVVFSPLLSFASRRLLEALPDNATTIGDSDLVSINVTFSDTLFARAFPPGEFGTTQKLVIGIIIGAIAFIVVIFGIVAFCYAFKLKEAGKRRERIRLTAAARGGGGGGGLSTRGNYMDHDADDEGSSDS
jgi:hypothetical protein